MVTLKNEILEVQIHEKGAELHGIRHLQHDIDYLWNANPEYWGKHAPVLFPVVGELKDNTYYYNNKAYSLSRHGFARDMKFTVVSHNATTAAFELSSNAETLDKYPFNFILRIRYTLEGNKLVNEYEVNNTGSNTMYFSIGGHPAFHIPLVKDTEYEDYYLELERKETVQRWPIKDNLISTHPQELLNDDDKIKLHHKLFAKDAIVIKHLRSNSISLRSARTKHGLTMNFEGFPYFGIWAAPDAPFVCLEPWCGIADSVHHNQQLQNKEGIIALEPGSKWNKSWSLELF